MEIYYFLFGGIFLVTIVFIVMYFFVFKKNKNSRLLKQIISLEKQYRNSLTFRIKHRLSKIESLSIQNEVFKGIFEEYNAKFENMEAIKNLIFDDLEMLKKSVAAGALKTDLIEEKISDLTARIENSSREHQEFNDFLIDLTKEEDDYREKIQELKEFYRNIMYTYNSSKNELFMVIDKFEQLFLEADQAFILLDNYVNTGNYIDAKELFQPVQEYLQGLKDNIVILPPFITKANHLLNKKLKEINLLYQQLTNENYPLYHLKFNKLNEDVEKNINIICDKLREFKINGVEEELKEIESLLESFEQSLEKEISAKKLYDQYCAEIYKNVEEVEKKYFNIKRGLPELKKVYLISQEQIDTLEEMQNSVVQLGSSKYALDTFIYSATKQPYSILVDRMKKMGELAKEVEDYLLNFDALIENLKEDVENIYNELDQMTVLVKTIYANVLQTNIDPFIATYKIKTQEISDNINFLKELLISCPIDVSRAKELYHEVKNNIVKVNDESCKNINFLSMAEQIIIFGNYYRETFSEVELNLKRSEIMLKNGDFLSSLDLAVEVVKKIHPDAYERASSVGK